MTFWRPDQRETGAGADSDFVKGIKVKRKSGFFLVAALFNLKNCRKTAVFSLFEKHEHCLVLKF